MSITKDRISAFTAAASHQFKTPLRQSLSRISLILGLSCLLMAASSGWPQAKGNKADPANKGTNLQGTIKVSGAWALYPMMVKWGEEFQKIHPNVRIDISAGGAGKGAADALAGLVDVGMVSREINPEEVKQGAFYIPVVKDAVFPTINAGNPILAKLTEKGVKKQTLIDLWINGKSLAWGEIVQTDSKDRVRVYTRSDSCGAAETWAQYLGRKRQEDLQGVGVYGDPGLAEAVRKDSLGLGFNNLNYAYDFKTGMPQKGLYIIPIDVNENGKLDPQEDLKTKDKAIRAVASGFYPSPPARDLYLLSKGGFKGPSRSFILWIVTDGQKYVDENGYVRLSSTQIRDSLKKLGD